MKLKLFFLSIFIVLGFVAYQKYSDYSSLKSINSYETCTEAKGSIIQESYPATCVTRIGSRFNEPIITINKITGWNIYTNRDRYFSFEYPPEWKYKDGAIFNSDETFIKPLTFTESDFTYWLSINHLNSGFVDRVTSTSSNQFGNNTVITTKLCNSTELYIKGGTRKPGTECTTISHLAYKDIGFVTVDLTPNPQFVEEEKIYYQILSTFKFTN